MSERINLFWNEFERCTLDSFQLLKHSEEFTDVTLVCDGENQIRAHKVIISACSPFFKNILLRNPHPNPLIYLNGVNFNDLKALINFMYSGQAEIAQDDLDSFMKAGLDLAIRGLEERKPNADKRNVYEISEPDRNDMEDLSTENASIGNEPPMESQELGVQHQSNVMTDNISLVDTSYIAQDVCDISMDVSKFQCDECQYSTKYKSNLKKHIKSVHEHVKLSCNKCDYQCSDSSNLEKHRRNKHSLF